MAAESIRHSSATTPGRNYPIVWGPYSIRYPGCSRCTAWHAIHKASSEESPPNALAYCCVCSCRSTSSLSTSTTPLTSLSPTQPSCPTACSLPPFRLYLGALSPSFKPSVKGKLPSLPPYCIMRSLLPHHHPLPLPLRLILLSWLPSKW